MSKITPFLWFDGQAEAAMNYYVETFNSAPNKTTESKINSISRYPEVAPNEHMIGLENKVINGSFELAGQNFIALDGGPMYKFTEAISLFVECQDQAEVDHFWNAFSAAPESEACGWLKDKYGLSWQIIPKQLGELASGPNGGKVMQAMMQMKKIVIADLEVAARN